MGRSLTLPGSSTRAGSVAPRVTVVTPTYNRAELIEELRGLALTDARVQVGGSLTADEADHSAVVNLPPAGLVRVRWVVAATTFGALEVHVRAIPLENSNSRMSDVRSLLWRPN